MTFFMIGNWLGIEKKQYVYIQTHHSRLSKHYCLISGLKNKRYKLSNMYKAWFLIILYMVLSTNSAKLNTEFLSAWLNIKIRFLNYFFPELFYRMIPHSSFIFRCFTTGEFVTIQYLIFNCSGNIQDLLLTQPSTYES